jgi:hypothetical protein
VTRLSKICLNFLEAWKENRYALIGDWMRNVRRVMHVFVILQYSHFELSRTAAVLQLQGQGSACGCRETDAIDSFRKGGLGCACGTNLNTVSLLCSPFGVFIRGTDNPSFAHSGPFMMENLSCCGQQLRAAVRLHFYYPWCELHFPRERKL